jgi:glycogen(starch) synthase
MRILFWSETFWPRIGGVENLAAKLLPALRARGHELSVVTWENINSRDQISYAGIPIYRFPFFSTPDESLTSIIQCRSPIMNLKQYFAPDLIHVNSYGRSILFHLNTINSHPAPVLLTLHQHISDEPVQRDSLLGHLLRTSDWVNTCSNSVLTQVRRLAPEIIPHSSVIYNALEAPSFNPEPLPFHPPQLLCVGRLVHEKGFDLALAAFSTVLDGFPRARLLIAGDGPERQRLTQRTSKLGLASSVDFLGSVPPETVLRLMNKATLVIIPSRVEGFGLVALESALMARPVVATNIGGLSEVVLHQKTGLLVQEDDQKGLANAVLFLLNHPQAADTFGAAARRRVKEVFRFEHHVDAYDQLYQRITRKVPGADLRKVVMPDPIP